MLAARRTLACSTRPCLLRRSLRALSPQPTLIQGATHVQAVTVITSGGAAARRCFAARIRRHGSEGSTETSGDAAPPPRRAEASSTGVFDEVHSAVAAALDGDVSAVASLGKLGAGAAIGGAKGVAAEAEEALYRILLEASGEKCEELRIAAEHALQMCWHESGDPEVNAGIRRGVALMDKEHIGEAVRIFEDIAEKLPAFAEVWNKLATARFLMEDLDGALEDCERVLALKPRHFGCLAGAGMCHERRNDLEVAARWFRRALAVHPGLEGPRRKVQAMEGQVLINEHLRPRIVTTVQALNDGAELPSNAPSGLSSSWEAFHEHAALEDRDPGHNYFFRIRILNQSDGPSVVRSLARFYVFRFADGRMLPLTLLTEGPAGFTLRPGEDYKFSWHLISAAPLERAVGGMLLEHGEGAEMEKVEREQESIQVLDLDLGATEPAAATTDEIERMRLGYPTAGRLDLRRMDSVQPKK